MKLLNSPALLTFISLGALLTLSSCSNDNDDNLPDNNLVMAELSIKTSAVTGNSNSGRNANADVNVSTFKINIKEIELEFDDDFCDDSDDINLSFSELPQEIKNYLENNYPNDPFCKAEQEEDDDEPYKYEVELASGLEIYFRSDFSVYAIETDDDPCTGSNSNTNINCNDYNGFYSSDDEIELMGPFEVDILTGNNTITTIDVPANVVFEELEFEFDVNTNPTSDLFGKTILIEGTVNNTEFVFWHNFEVEFEIDYEDTNQNIDISNGFNSIIIEFDLAGLFSTVDLSNATDNNGDGIIEISPNDDDGNNNLADQIKDLIEEYADLLDD